MSEYTIVRLARRLSTTYTLLNAVTTSQDYPESLSSFESSVNLRARDVWFTTIPASPHTFQSCRSTCTLRLMDELAEFKRFLGPAGKEYSNSQLQQLRREMHTMAGLLLDIYLQKKDLERPAQNPAKDFDAHRPKP